MILDDIARNCLANSDSTNKIVVEVMYFKLTLDLDKLNEYRDFITELFNNILYDDELYPSSNIVYDKSGNYWCSYYEGELLIMMGKALGIIKVLPNKNGLPFIIKESKKEEPKLVLGG